MNKYQRKNIFKLCKGMTCRLRERRSPVFLAIFDKCRIHNYLVRKGKCREAQQLKGLHIQQSIMPCKEQAMESWASKIHWSFCRKQNFVDVQTFQTPFFLFSEAVGCLIHNFPGHEDSAACAILLVLTLLCVRQARCSAVRLVPACKLSHSLCHQSQLLYTASAGQLWKGNKRKKCSVAGERLGSWWLSS